MLHSKEGCPCTGGDTNPGVDALGVVADLLTVCSGDHLLYIQRFFPAEESRNVRRAVVERENVERSCIARDHEESFFFALQCGKLHCLDHICLLEMPGYGTSPCRFLSIQANNFWKESMNFCTPSTCSCRVTWS